MRAQHAGQPRPAKPWLVVLLSTLFCVLGCHMVFGGFEEGSNAGATGLCDKGAARCNDEYLLSCNSQQTAWVRKDTCASKEQCDSKSGSCLVCPKADALRCNGSKLEACNSKRTSWDFREDCGSPELCGPGGCGPCETPGALQCANDPGTNMPVIRECDPVNKVWKPVVTCNNSDLCMATLTRAQGDPLHWDRKCDFVCTPGSFRCDGVHLQRCPQNGVNWMAVSSCGSEALCKLTLSSIEKDPNLAATVDKCEPGCGTAGQARCRDGNVLERCSQDQTTWQVAMECPTGMQCTTQGQGDCVVCTPGDYQCNGPALERCGDDHLWKQVQDCKTAALCRVQNDPNTGKSMGSCDTPACLRAGDNVCGSDTDPKVPGATLWECKTDLTGYVKGLTCETAELCRAADKACAPPLCKAGNRRCNPGNTLQVQECNPGQTNWNLVTTCKAGEFCDPNDSAQPCKHECPAPLLCNDRFLQTCSASAGVVNKAECDTKELCACAVAGNCPAGTKTDGCGKPVCGATLANFRCTDSTGTATSGPILQQCKPGRDGWNRVNDCGATNLCYPGPSPAFTNGYCATCPLAGEVACMGSATQVCAADRKSWTGQTSCAFGCVDSATTDYCAQCFSGEKRCSGSQLLACSMDQKSLPVQSNCAFGCVDSGNTDYCGICGVGETRCAGSVPGSKLQVCAAGQNALTDMSTCANGCIDSGTADYCAECRAGESQCFGTGVRTCGTNGRWGAVTACTNGTCVDAGTADYCPGCAPNELRCSGSTLLQCSADQKSLTTVMTCANGCVDSGTTDYCAACQANELRCSASTLQQCSMDRKSLSTAQTCTYGCIESGIADYCAVCSVGELRCSASTLQVCSTDQKSLTNSQACTNGCFDSGSADYCGDCKPGETRCTTTGGLQTCGTDGRWGATVTACGNGCFGTYPVAYCGVCRPGVDTQCAGSKLQSCTTGGQWSNEEMAPTCSMGCIDSGTNDFCAECTAGDKTCSGSTLQTCTNGRYNGGTPCALGCFGSTPNARCGICSADQTNCAAGTLQSCVNGTWNAGTPCTNGCIDQGTSDFCAACPVNGTQCATSSTLQVCENGVWGEPMACPNNACVGNSCAQCTPMSTVCSGTTSIRTCSSSGSWQDPVACPNNACLNNACVDCMPNSVLCTDTTQAKTCGSNGTWSMPAECPNHACVNDACVDCQPNAVQCANSTQSQVCDSTGHWGVASNCTSGACVNDACAACVPGTKQCVTLGPGMSGVQLCGQNGQWGTPTSCAYGCNDNGTADDCQPCEVGTSQCAEDLMSLATCQVGGFMTESCMNSCFDNGNHDYCRDCSGTQSVCTSPTQYHACGPDGHWQPQVDCAPDNKVCYAGACVDCTPGTSKCEPDGVSRRLCNQSGSWSDPQPCTTTCNTSTNMCD
ncbi:MAG: hypothetical protein ACOY0T_21795 [Myxococcota bacterium]